MPGQSTIDEGEVGVDEVENTPILVLDRSEIHLGFPKHRRPKRLGLRKKVIAIV